MVLFALFLTFNFLPLVFKPTDCATMLLTDFEYLNTSEIAFKKKVALQIKRLRRQNQVSQEKFYSETNINIARLESGKVDIRLDTLRKVCYYFDVSLSGFFHGIYLSILLLNT